MNSILRPRLGGVDSPARRTVRPGSPPPPDVSPNGAAKNNSRSKLPRLGSVRSSAPKC